MRPILDRLAVVRNYQEPQPIASSPCDPAMFANLARRSICIPGGALLGTF